MHLGALCMQLRAPVSFLSLWEGPKMVFFPTLSTKSQTFYTINFFSDSTEGFALLLGECAALCRQIA